MVVQFLPDLLVVHSFHISGEDQAKRSALLHKCEKVAKELGTTSVPSKTPASSTQPTKVVTLILYLALLF